MAKKIKSSDLIRSLKRIKPVKSTSHHKKKKKTVKLFNVGWGLPREFGGLMNFESIIVKRAAMYKIATLDKTGRKFYKKTLNLKDTGSNRQWLRSTSNFQSEETKSRGELVQDRINRRLEKETVKVWDKKTGDYKTITRTVTSHTKYWSVVDAIIPMSEKEAAKAFQHLGFETTKWIKDYGEKWKVALSWHILRNEEEYKQFNVADAMRYLAYAKNKRVFSFTEFEFKKLYNKKTEFIGHEVPLYKVVKELLEKNYIDKTEIAKIHGWALGQYKGPAWQQAYYTYNNLDTSRLTELLGKPDNPKLIDELDRDFKYRLGDMHRYNARQKGLDDPYFKEWKGEGYEDLCEYIEQHPEDVVLTYNNVLALASSENFHRAFFRVFDYKWGETATRAWLDNYIIQGRTAYKNLSNRVWREFVGTKLRVFDKAWKDPNDPRFEQALESVLEAITNEDMIGYIAPKVIDEEIFDYNIEDEEEYDEDDEE